jgi:hypothetical protein
MIATMDDTEILEEMRQLLAKWNTNLLDIGDLAERLLSLRDALDFDDDKWYDEITEQIVTLDSASTFRPASTAEGRQLREVVGRSIELAKDLVLQKQATLISG